MIRADPWKHLKKLDRGTSQNGSAEIPFRPIPKFINAIKALEANKSFSDHDENVNTLEGNSLFESHLQRSGPGALQGDQLKKHNKNEPDLVNSTTLG